MRKVIAAINTTIDGVCDHTVGMANEEVHDHYANLINEAGVILYGRITYQLMQYWQSLLANPSGEKSMDDFAIAMDGIPKIVFSSSLSETGWDSASKAVNSLEETVKELKQQPGKDILIGSRSLIIQLLNAGLVDEFQLCIHPMVEGKGLKLFDQIKKRIIFKLVKTKTMENGVSIFYYQPI